MSVEERVARAVDKINQFKRLRKEIKSRNQTLISEWCNSSMINEVKLCRQYTITTNTEEEQKTIKRLEALNNLSQDLVRFIVKLNFKSDELQELITFCEFQSFITHDKIS